MIEGKDSKESQTSGIILVAVNSSMFWKISRLSFIVHRLCNYDVS